METSSNNKLRKVCSQCSATVHVRRAVCGCGYAFPPKRRLRAGDVQAKKEERADRLYRANLRASETPQETATRLKRNSARIASMRASETPQETATRSHACAFQSCTTHIYLRRGFCTLVLFICKCSYTILYNYCYVG